MHPRSLTPSGHNEQPRLSSARLALKYPVANTSFPCAVRCPPPRHCRSATKFYVVNAGACAAYINGTQVAAYNATGAPAQHPFWYFNTSGGKKKKEPFLTSCCSFRLSAVRLSDSRPYPRTGSFGELALMYSAPRAATVRATVRSPRATCQLGMELSSC